jgi:hypothetical protein
MYVQLHRHFVQWSGTSDTCERYAILQTFMVLLNNHSKAVDKSVTLHMKFSPGLSVSSLMYKWISE